MRTMRTIPILAVAGSLLLATAASAHGPDKGPNGGRQVDAGDYHVELVTKDTDLTVYLRTDKDKDVEATGHKATAILVVSGKPQRIELTPAGGNRLSGKSAVPVPATAKGAVQITTPSGKTAQAKF